MSSPKDLIAAAGGSPWAIFAGIGLVVTIVYVLASPRPRWVIAGVLLVVTAIATITVSTVPVSTSGPAAASSAAVDQRPAAAVGPFTVVAVIDGDTLLVSRAGSSRKVRLIGVDTPEVRKPGTPVQCWGPEASAVTKQLVAAGTVWLEHDDVAGDTDRYGRELAYVWVNDTLVNYQLIEAGAARQYAFSNQQYRYREVFERAERSAQRESVGLWGACS